LLNPPSWQSLKKVKVMSFDYQLHDVIGVLGVTMIVSVYLLLQLGRLSSQSLLYSVLNGLGAALVLFSLYFEFNLSAVVIELFWLGISVLGVILALRRRAID